jgi:hypothetical protein
MLGRRHSPRTWSWQDVRERTLAIYRAGSSVRSRIAVLVWQGEDRQVELHGAAPPLLAFTMDVEAEADEDNAVAVAGFDSLEAAREHCVAWVGAPAEASWDALGEAAQIGVYAAIRDPGFAAES